LNVSLKIVLTKTCMRYKLGSGVQPICGKFGIVRCLCVSPYVRQHVRVSVLTRDIQME